MKIDTDAIKAESERIVLAAGGEICDWLPYIEFSKMRDNEDVVARALILNAMLNIHFQAPTHIIADWIERHDLNSFLSEREKSILARDNEQLSQQELIDLYWYIEALWALLWATKIVDKMDFTTPIPDSMAALCPNLQMNEGDEKLQKMELRGYEEIYKERDLYYRVMWCARQWSLTGRKSEDFDLSRTLERRRALEWIMDTELDWDDVPQGT